MRSQLVALVAALLTACATKPDPIDRLVTQLSARQWFWHYGIYPSVDLPSTASPGEVIKEVFGATGFETGGGIRRVAQYKVLKVRDVEIQPGSRLYKAALVETDLGKKIVVFQYLEEMNKWWTRVYDAGASV